MDVSLRRSCLQTALAGLEGGHADAAEHICRDLIRQDPDDTQALLLLGLALGLGGKAQQAAPILNRVAGLSSGFAHPCLDFGR